MLTLTDYLLQEEPTATNASGNFPLLLSTIEQAAQLPRFRPKTPPCHSSAKAHPGDVAKARDENLDRRRGFWDA
jgi:hypothetical protein